MMLGKGKGCQAAAICGGKQSLETNFQWLDLERKFFATRSVIALFSITHLTSLLDIILEHFTKETAEFPDLKQTEK